MDSSSGSSSSVTLQDDSDSEWTDTEMDADEDKDDKENKDLDKDLVTGLKYSFFKQSPPLVHVHSKDDYSWADHESCDPLLSLETVKALSQALTKRSEGAPSSDGVNLTKADTVPVLLKYKCGSIGTICDTMNERGGWVEQEDETTDDWDLDFMDLFDLRDFNLKKGFDRLKENQRIGHFQNCNEIARKSFLIRNLKRFRYSVERCLGFQAGTNIDFFPTTFIIPYEHDRFQDEFATNPGNIWILKPASGAKGNGITIVEKLEDYLAWKEKQSKGELPCQQSNPNKTSTIVKGKFPWYEEHDDYKYYSCPGPSYFEPRRGGRGRGPKREDNTSNSVPVPEISPRIEIIELEGGTSTPRTPKDVTVKFITKRALSPDVFLGGDLGSDIHSNTSSTEDLTIETDADVDDVDNYCTESYEDIIADTAFIKWMPDDPFADGDGLHDDLYEFGTLDEDDYDDGDESDDSLWPPYNTSEFEFRLEGPDIPKETFIVQRYIPEPYLIGGKKFDLRIFVLATSYDPLVAYTYREGFARFSVEQYSLSCTHDVEVHLTNVFVQRHAMDYSDGKGTKWPLNRLCQHFIEIDGREAVDGFMHRMDALVVRTLQSVAHRMDQYDQSFELYGFDILVDRHLKPWLLEVNAAPACTPSDDEDYQLKCRLIDDLVYVLDMEKRLLELERRVGGWDLIWADGPIYREAVAVMQDVELELEIELNQPADEVNQDEVEVPKLNSSFGASNDDREFNLREILLRAHLAKTNLEKRSQNPVQKFEDDFSAEGPFYPIPTDTRFFNPFRPVRSEPDDCDY